MITGKSKVDRLLLAMAEHEGWYPVGDPRAANGSRAYRNHNPGNLRQSPYQVGTDGGFAVFQNDFMGFFALYWDIYQKAQGKTRTELNGQSTIRDLLYVWAPPSDGNDTEAYVKRVETLSGIPANTTLAEIFETQ